MKNLIKLLIAIVLILGIIYGLWYWQLQKKMATMIKAKPKPPAVSVSQAQSQEWQPTVSSVGQLVSNHGVMIQSEGSGVVQSLSVESGQMVRRNQLLVVLAHQNAQATLQDKRAAYLLAQREHGRYAVLALHQNVSQQALDMKHTAMVAAHSAMVKARDDYSNQFIRAPFACRLGILRVHMGQLVAVNDPIVNCEDVRTLELTFSLPQQFVSKVHVGLPVHLHVDAYGESVFNGVLSAIGPKISEVTRSIDLEAKVPNMDAKLWPGMLVKVRIPVGPAQPVITIPQTAVHPTLYGDYVFLVTQDKKGGMVAKQVKVQLGDAVGEAIIIRQGLHAGDRVVSLGQATLRDGAAIRIVSSVSQA